MYRLPKLIFTFRWVKVFKVCCHCPYSTAKYFTNSLQKVNKTSTAFPALGYRIRIVGWIDGKFRGLLKAGVNNEMSTIDIRPNRT